MEIESVCPECGESSKYDIDLLQILSQKVNIDYTKSLIVRDLEIKFRPLNYSEINKNNLSRYQVEKTIRLLNDGVDDESKQQHVKQAFANLNTMLVDILVQSIEYIKTDEVVVTDKQFIREFLDNCDTKTSKAIKEFGIDLRQKNDSKPITLSCEHCHHEYKQSLVLNFTDFFE
jgi:hypothetical protein